MNSQHQRHQPPQTSSNKCLKLLNILWHVATPCLRLLLGWSSAKANPGWQDNSSGIRTQDVDRYPKPRLTVAEQHLRRECSKSLWHHRRQTSPRTMKLWRRNYFQLMLMYLKRQTLGQYIDFLSILQKLELEDKRSLRQYPYQNFALLLSRWEGYAPQWEHLLKKGT